MNRTLSFVALLSLLACSSEPTPAPDGLSLPEGPCGHALLVLSTDYKASSSVGVVGFDGEVLAPSMLSSGSATVGLSSPLSGDVVVPTTPTPNGIVVIDRTPLGVVTWFDPVGAKVTRQLSVGPATNPQDYLEIADHKAYVSRYDVNPQPGAEPFDRGQDVLVIDPSAGSKLASITFGPQFTSLPAGILPHPGRMVATTSEVLVLVATYSSDFKQSGDSALVRIDPSTDKVKGIVPLTGLRGCTALALSPTSDRIAVGCSGTFGGTSTPTLADSGVIVLDAKSFAVLRAFNATTLRNQPVGFSISFASDDVLFVPTDGSVDASTPDHLLSANVATGAVTTLATSPGAFDFGEVRCASSCGACFLTVGSSTNASENRVSRFAIDANGAVMGSPEEIRIGDGHLAPRYLGIY